MNRLTEEKVLKKLNNLPKDYVFSTEELIYLKLGQLENLMEKYKIENANELEHIIINEGTGEAAFEEYKNVYVKPYKDIEQELGIDLVTLFKALHSEKIYFKKQEYRKGKISYFKRFKLVTGADNILRIIGEVKEQYTIYNYGCEFGIILDLKDYGKTWALSKEELKK